MTTSKNQCGERPIVVNPPAGWRSR